jgi:hypothetical protein
MTRTEKLDSILYGLLAIDKKRLDGELINKSVTIEWISQSLKLDCEIWEMKSLKNELLDKGLITEIDGELHITEKGKNFSTREKGFSQLDKVANQEDKIREETINKFRYDKIAFWISIAAFIIAVISLIATMTEPITAAIATTAKK